MNKIDFFFLNKNRRVVSVDFLRGIAAFAVMFFHYTAYTSITLSDDNPLRVTGVYGHYGVEIFFILSGFIIPYSMHLNSYKLKEIWKFLMKRTVRIEIPYLALILIEVVLIYVISLTAWKSGPSQRLDAYNILLHVGYLNGLFGRPWLIPVFWTLAIEFQFYLLIAILFPLLIKSDYYKRIVVVALALMSFVFPYEYLFFKYALFFLAGIITFQLMTGVMKKLEFYFFMVAFLLLAYYQHGMVSCIIITGSVIIILYGKFSWRWASLLGMISYSLYLIHVPFGGRLLMLTQMYVQQEWLRSLLILFYLLLTVLASWVFYLLIEKTSLAWSKKITYK